MTNETERFNDLPNDAAVPDTTGDEALWNDFWRNKNKNACARLIEQNQHFAVSSSILRAKKVCATDTRPRPHLVAYPCFHRTGQEF